MLERGSFSLEPPLWLENPMRRKTVLFITMVCAIFAYVPTTLPQPAPPPVIDFKVQALYRAAKLTWSAPTLKEALSVKILRASSSADGPYQEIEVIKLVPGKSAYDYLDKSMGAESMYFYKLVTETGESFGPVSTRPFFSPPAT